jgi:hypothetical protein
MMTSRLTAAAVNPSRRGSSSAGPQEVVSPRGGGAPGGMGLQRERRGYTVVQRY